MSTYDTQILPADNAPANGFPVTDGTLDGPVDATGDSDLSGASRDAVTGEVSELTTQQVRDEVDRQREHPEPQAVAVVDVPSDPPQAPGHNADNLFAGAVARLQEAAPGAKTWAEVLEAQRNASN